MNFYPLTVVKTTQRIGGNAKTVEFAVPADLQHTFTWQAGQHITLKFMIDGEEIRRSYTISASPHTQENLQITVKRVKDGLISNHINDSLKEGAVIEVMPPSGNFILEPQQKIQRTHYFFGAGSGITPLYAMINSVLSAEPNSVCYLLYANKNDSTMIYKDELEWLEKESQGALTASHVFSKPGWTSSFQYWADGKIDTAMIEKFINEHPPYAQDAQYYICGPGNMNSEIKKSLMSLDVPADRIHFESFGGGTAEIEQNITGIAATLLVELENQEYSVEVSADQTLLEAMRIAGVHAPFSCQSGVCGACKANISSGEVAMKARMALEDEDIDKGEILTCQALCRTEQVSIIFPH